MKNTKFKPILNKDKFVEAFKEQTFPQIEKNLEAAISSLIEKELLLNKNGTINKVGQDALKYATELNNGAEPLEIAKQMKGKAHKNLTEQDVKDSFTILGILAYFVKGGPKVFTSYLDHHKTTFSKEGLEDITRQEGRHKVYEAEVNLSKIREEASKKLK